MNALVSVFDQLGLNSFQFVGLMVAVIVFLIMLKGLLSGDVEQNLATYLLWAALDGIAAGSTFVKGGNWMLPAFYTFVGVVTSATIWKIGKFSWTKLETQVSVSVSVCIIVWGFSGPWYATILSTFGMFLAGTAQIKDAWLKPETSPIWVYVGSSFANLMNTVGGRNWAVEERFYPFWCTILTGLVVVATLRRYLPEPVETK